MALTKWVPERDPMVLRRIGKTGALIEAHDELSREWGQRKVDTHNNLYPAAQWAMTEEQL